MSMPLSAIHPEMYLWGCMRDERQPSANYDRDREYQRALFSALEKEEKDQNFWHTVANTMLILNRLKVI